MTWRAQKEEDGEQPYVQFDFKKPETVNRLRLSSNREYFYDTDYLDKEPYLPRYEYDMCKAASARAYLACSDLTSRNVLTTHSLHSGPTKGLTSDMQRGMRMENGWFMVHMQSDTRR